MEPNLYTPPARKSLSDEELQDALGAAQADEAGILAAMELLELQSNLREEDNRAFEAWAAELEAIGTPEALLAIAVARGIEFELPSTVESRLIEGESSPLENAANVDEIAASLNAFYSGQVDEKPQPQVIEGPEFSQISEPLESEIVAVEHETLIESDELEDVPVQSVPTPAPERISDLPTEGASVAIQTERAKPARDKTTSGRSQILLWLGLTSGLLPFAVAYALFASGMSLQESLVSILIGFTLSGLVFSAGALAGKRSGLPTLALSRSAFGVYGNLVPGVPVAAMRVIAPALILLSLVWVISGNSSPESPALFPLSTSNWPVLLVLVLGLVALATAVLLTGKVGRLTQKFSPVAVIASALLMLGVSLSTFNFGNLTASDSAALSSDSVAYGVLIFCFAGLFWSTLGAELSMSLTRQVRGASAVTWVLLGSAVIPAVLTVWYLLSMLGASSTFKQSLDSSFQAALLGTSDIIGGVFLAISVFTWLVAAINSALTTVAGLTVNPVRRIRLTVLISLLTTFIVGGAVLLIDGQDLWPTIFAIVIVGSVPVSAWAGVFVCDVLLRKIAYHEVSLSRSYGFYRPVNITNVVAWLVSTLLGFGVLVLDTQTLPALGFLAQLTDSSTNFAGTYVAVLISFGMGLLAPIVAGIGRIKRQEQEVLATEARRDDLKDIFKFGE